MPPVAWLSRAAAPLRLAAPRSGRDALLRVLMPRSRGRGALPAPAAMTTRAVEEARGRHARTLHAVFAHPTSANLRWREVLSMLESFGAQHHPSSGGAKERVELGGRALFLAKPHHSGRHDASSLASPHEILALRKFLEDSGLAPADACGARSPASTAHAAAHAANAAMHAPEKPSERGPASAPPEALDGRHVLLWVSHAEARLYRTQSSGGAAVLAPVLLHPPGDPDGLCRHLRAKKAPAHAIAPPSAAGDRLPVLDSAFAKSIIAALPPDGVDEIILAGHGTGKASAVDALTAAMEAKAPALARKVSHRLRLSEGHATDAQLCAAARDFYDQRRREQAAAAAAAQGNNNA